MPHASSPKNVFFSYSHKDAIFLDALEAHLALLKRQGVIKTWHDRDIDAGRVIDTEIQKNIEAAHIILLLISSDFINSDYCYSKELTHALQRHEVGTAIVLPIIVRPCDWRSAPFGELKAVPDDGRPITEWPNQDTAFVNVVDAIRKLAEKTQDEKKPAVRTDDGTLCNAVAVALFRPIGDEPAHSVASRTILANTPDSNRQDVEDAITMLGEQGYARIVETSRERHIALTPRGVRFAWELIDANAFRLALMSLRAALAQSAVTDLQRLSDASQVPIGLTHAIVSDWANRSLLTFSDNVAPWQRSRVSNVSLTLKSCAPEEL